MTEKTGNSGYQFGTFKGVYTPSLLTILGVLMYLRLGWVLGQTGLWITLLIVLIASAITFLTGLSLAALATNMHIGGGGAYYIISRSLGVEAGSAIGLPLYLAQSLGISFYIAGFSESIVQIFPYLDPRMVGLLTLILLTLLVYLSADLALKSQFIIMAIIAASLVSFFLGPAPGTLYEAVETPDAEAGVRLPFWAVFAVFFPAVTGIEAGIAMSGDLKNPARSLPLGTMLAIVSGLLVYLAIPVVLYLRQVPETLLLSDPLVLRHSSRWGQVIVAGIWAASLSSAMGALLGAPRTLQALANDRVLPRFIGKGYGPGKDPRIAILISFAIGIVGILLGDINLIAPILSMFFLTSYGVLNLSAGLEALVSPPSWRPRFHVPALVSIAGFFACFGVMFMINAGATFIAGFISLAVYFVMKRRSLQARWGDMRMGVLMYLSRTFMHQISELPRYERSWKPNLLVLSGSPASRWYLIKIADDIAQGNSFVTVATIVPETGFTQERLESMSSSVRQFLKKQKVRAFVRVLPAKDIWHGARMLIHAYGYGPVQPNTVLVGETESPEHFVRFSQLIKYIHQTGKNLIVIREKEDTQEASSAEEEKRIDIWWAGESVNMGFMFTVAWLVAESEGWVRSTLSIRTIISEESERKRITEKLNNFLSQSRTRAELDVVLQEHDDPFETIREKSADAGIVFLGLRPPKEEEDGEAYSLYYRDVLYKTEGLPVTALVMAAENVDFDRIFKQ